MAITKRQQEAIDLYHKLMEEAKVRLDAILSAINGETKLPSALVREFCFLQLRMLCEVIALGCLTAHGDIKAAQTPKLQKEHSAEKIIKQLEELHGDFYPEPCQEEKSDGNYRHFVALEPGAFLTKLELLALYGKCGDVLHRGNVKKLLKPQMPVQITYPEIHRWAEKINLLLATHRVLLFDGKAALLCALRVTEFGGNVQIAFSEVMDDQPQP